MNDLSRVFTKNNMKILKTIRTTDNLYIREIAEKTRVSPATVHSAVKLFKKLGMVIERNVKNRKVVSLNRNSVLLKKINALLNFYEISRLKEFRKLQRYGNVGVFGSFAMGEDLPESDIDLWIYSDKKLDAAELKGITRGLERRLGKEVKLLILSPKKLKGLRDRDPEFYFRLKLTSITFGDVFD
jgi:predicted nucleotidyltransferase